MRRSYAQAASTTSMQLPIVDEQAEVSPFNATGRDDIPRQCSSPSPACHALFAPAPRQAKSSAIEPKRSTSTSPITISETQGVSESMRPRRCATASHVDGGSDRSRKYDHEDFVNAHARRLMAARSFRCDNGSRERMESSRHPNSCKHSHRFDYRRIFQAITNTTLEELSYSVPDLSCQIAAEDLDPALYTVENLSLLRARFHCAAYHGKLDEFCKCCMNRSPSQVRLRCDAIEIAVLVFQDYHTVEFGYRPTHWSALLAAKNLLDGRGIRLRDIEVVCLKAQRLVAFTKAQELEFRKRLKKQITCVDRHGHLSVVENKDDELFENRLQGPDSLSDSGIESGNSSVRSSSIDSPLDLRGSTGCLQASSSHFGGEWLAQPSDIAYAELCQPARDQEPDSTQTLDSEAETEVSIPDIHDNSRQEQPSAEPECYGELGDECIPSSDLETKQVCKARPVQQRVSRKKTHRKTQRKQINSKSPRKDITRSAYPPDIICEAPISLKAFPLKDGTVNHYQRIKEIPEQFFETSHVVQNRVGSFRETCMTNDEALHRIELLSQRPPCWDRDFELRCLDLHIFNNDREQDVRQHTVLNWRQVRSHELHGITNERLRLSCGKIAVEEHTESALLSAEHYIKHEERVAKLRTSLAALFDFTIQQFHHSWHLVPEDRVTLLDRLKKRLNSIGGKFITNGYQRRAGEGFRGIFNSLQHAYITETRKQQANMMHQFGGINEATRNRMIQVGDTVAIMNSGDSESTGEQQLQFYPLVEHVGGTEEADQWSYQ